MRFATDSFFRLTMMVMLLIYSVYGTASTESIRGQAFTSPDHPAVMPDKWQQQSINYDKAVKQADLVVSRPANLPCFKTSNRRVRKKEKHEYPGTKWHMRYFSRKATT